MTPTPPLTPTPARRVFVFAGGGTGGHLFPALAILEELNRQAKSPVGAAFLCSTRPIDAEILSRAGVEFTPIPAQPFGLRPRAFMRFARSWGSSVRAARAAISWARSGGDATLVAMGGFVAAPAARAAHAERVPVVLVNMDAVPGRANRWIARRAQRVFTSAAVQGSSAKLVAPSRARWIAIPPIVRPGAVASEPPDHCREAGFELDPSRPTLLVLGGSQGARSINRLMMHIAEHHAVKLVEARWQVIHQTGAGEDSAVADAYRAAGIPACVRPFIAEMGLAWGAADVAISRAGAGSVGEAWANHVPAVFIPYPYHRDQHQRANAEPLIAAGGAVVIDDPVLDPPSLPAAADRIVALLRDFAEQRRMRSFLRLLGPADGAARLAAELLAPPSGSR